jgi:hypothetical protein
LSDQHGYVRGSAGWLASKARVSRDECDTAIEALCAPDASSRTPDYDGRRVELLADGFLVLNYIAFRDRLSSDPVAVATRDRVRKHRERYIALRNAASVTSVVSASVDASVDASPSDEGEGVKGKGGVEFDAFWQAYPRKVGRKAAIKAWNSAKDRPPLADVLAAVETQKRLPAWTKDGGQFIPHPATWLNQGRWDDGPPEAGQHAGGKRPAYRSTLPNIHVSDTPDEEAVNAF